MVDEYEYMTSSLLISAVSVPYCTRLEIRVERHAQSFRALRQRSARRWGFVQWLARTGATMTDTSPVPQTSKWVVMRIWYTCRRASHWSSSQYGYADGMPETSDCFIGRIRWWNETEHSSLHAREINNKLILKHQSLHSTKVFQRL